MRLNLHSHCVLWFLLGLLIFPPTIFAQETDSTGVTGRVLSFLSSDIYRVSLGGSSITLLNPVGFDVSGSTHQNGRPQSGAFSPGGKFSWTITGETALRGKRIQKWLWSVHYDTENFVGLELQNLMFGGGWAFDPANSYAFGGRLAGGLGTGVTRSSSFFDTAGHLSFEAWVSIGVQLGRFTIDATFRERRALSSTLDERSASPSTRIRGLAIGWVF